jgi:predicted translin family RNA/ssDNA-binding protein
MEVSTLRKEMIRTQTKLEDLVEKHKDLNIGYVNNKLEDYDELLQYYSILHTKQQMDKSNVEPNEWWELT